MSYWYERFTKKHIVVFLLFIPVAFWNNCSQVALSYASGCVPTASRTLYDWISVERSFNSFEAYPYVHMMLDTGCIEWLGFSTCEAVQFQDWMPIWMQNELVTIHIFNVTAVEQEDPSKFQTAALSPIVVDRVHADRGTSSSPGELHLKRLVTYNFNSDNSRLDEFVITSDPTYVSGADTNPWIKASLSELLGLGKCVGGGHADCSKNYCGCQVPFLDLNPMQDNNVFVLPSPSTQLFHSRTLFYFLSTSSVHRKCLFDEDCAQQCTWAGLCEPLSYGHQGTLLPSATLFFSLKPLQELGHWPIPAWDYRLYCPFSALDPSCLNEPRRVIIFNPETYSREIFENTGDTTSDKFPDMEFQLWRSTRFARRMEGCNAPDIFAGRPGKDCDVPPEYVFVGDNFFLSSPRSSQVDTALLSEIYSERVTGLRFDYLYVWQINRRLALRKSKTMNSDTFLALFWIQQQPLGLKINEDLQFSELKGYPRSMMIIEIIGICLYCLTYFAMLGLLFWSSTCVGYMIAVGDEFKHLKPVYF